MLFGVTSFERQQVPVTLVLKVTPSAAAEAVVARQRGSTWDRR